MSGPALKPRELGVLLREASRKALGGGVAGALAMVVQVLTLMWMRTTINFQHAKGLSTGEAMTALYAQGGLPRFYQGIWAALLQAPISRFGDTASNAGMLAVLAGSSLSPGSKTFAASCAAALFRILITPIDTFKTTMQVQGSSGLALLSERISREGVLTLYAGALGASLATLVGHYPWFVTFNFLEGKIPPASQSPYKQMRRALIGFMSSMTSDIVSNSVRVVKTTKQTHPDSPTYLSTISLIIKQDGLEGLFLRGLSTKIVSNGISAMLFTVLWRYFEEKITAYQKRRHAAEACNEDKEDKEE